MEVAQQAKHLCQICEGEPHLENLHYGGFGTKKFFASLYKINHLLIVFTCHPCRTFFRRAFLNHHSQKKLQCKNSQDSCEGPALRKCTKCRWSKCER